LPEVFLGLGSISQVVYVGLALVKSAELESV